MANLLDLEELHRLQRLYPDWELMSEKDQNRLLAAQRRKKTGDFFSGLWGGDDDVNISQQPSTPVGAEEEVGLLQRPLSLDDMDTRIITRGLLGGEDTPRPSRETNPLESGRAFSAEALGFLGDIVNKPLWNELFAPAGGGIRSAWTGEDYKPLQKIEGEPFLGKHYWRTLFGIDRPEGMEIQGLSSGKKEGEVPFDLARFPQVTTTDARSGVDSVAAARAKDVATATTPPVPEKPQNNVYDELGLGPDENARMKEIDKNYWMARMMLRAGNASSSAAESYLSKSTQQLGLELNKYDRAIRLATMPKVTWYWYDASDRKAPIVLPQGVQPPAGYQQTATRQTAKQIDWSSYDDILADETYKTDREAYRVMADRLMSEDAILLSTVQYGGTMGAEQARRMAFSRLRNRYNPSGPIPYTDQQVANFKKLWEEEEWDAVMAAIEMQNGWPDEFDARVKSKWPSL